MAKNFLFCFLLPLPVVLWISFALVWYTHTNRLFFFFSFAPVSRDLSVLCLSEFGDLAFQLPHCLRLSPINVMPRLGGQMLSNAPGPSVWESMALTLVLSDCTQGASLFGTWFQPVCLARVQPFCPGLGVKPFLWQVSSSGPFPVWWSWDTAVRAFRTGTRSGARERQDLQVRRKGLRSQLLSQLSWFVAFPGWMWQRC